MSAPAPAPPGIEAPRASVRLKRAYDEPHPDDGYRVLVDRVWPRGRTKAALRLDAWTPQIAPTAKLRKWFGHDPDRWPAFRSRYRAELASPASSAALDELAAAVRTTIVTLVFSARDRERNQAVVIADEIASRARRKLKPGG